MTPLGSQVLLDLLEFLFIHHTHVHLQLLLGDGAVVLQHVRQLLLDLLTPTHEARFLFLLQHALVGGFFGGHSDLIPLLLQLADQVLQPHLLGWEVFYEVVLDGVEALLGLQDAIVIRYEVVGKTARVLKKNCEYHVDHYIIAKV